MVQHRYDEEKAGMRPIRPRNEIEERLQRRVASAPGQCRLRQPQVSTGALGAFLGEEYGAPCIYWHLGSGESEEQSRQFLSIRDRVLRELVEADFRAALGTPQLVSDRNQNRFQRWRYRVAPKASRREKLLWAAWLPGVVLLLLLAISWNVAASYRSPLIMLVGANVSFWLALLFRRYLGNPDAPGHPAYKRRHRQTYDD